MSGGNSIRKLPPGKLQSLREWYEERDAQASGATLYGITPRTGEEKLRPNSTAVERRIVPSTGTSPALSARKTWVAPDFVTASALKVSKGQENVPRVFGQGRQRSLSEKQDSLTPAAHKVESPTLANQETLFSNSSNSRRDAKRAGKFGAELREGRPDKRFSDPTADDAEIKSFINGRQRAMSDVSVKPGETSVLDRLKRSEKASLYARPAVTVFGQNMSSVSNAQRRFTKTNGQNNDSGRNVLTSSGTERNFEKLKGLWNNQSTPVGTGRESTTAFSQQDLKSVDPLIPPPAKPPRTFAHDDYLQSRILDSENQNAQSVKGRQTDVHHAVSVKARVSTLNTGTDVSEELSLRKGTQDGYSRLAQNQNAEGTREVSSSQFKPSRLRPISEGTALSKHMNHLPVDNTGSDDTAASDGPVVISLKYGRLDAPAKVVAGLRRNPFDKLPETPKQASDLEEFKLRKSLSSECLDKGATSSLSEAGEGDSLNRSARRGSYAEKERIRHHYETLVDTHGYATPHSRVKVQRGGDGLTGEDSTEHGKGDHLKHPLGPPPPEGAAAPASTAMATPVEAQDIENVPRKKMNLVRQKINQAYEVLNIAFNVERPTSISEDDKDRKTGDQTQQDTVDSESDSTVDAKEIKRRVNYCSAVRLKTSQNMKRTMEFLDKIYPQLFEYALIVGLCARGDKPGYDPFIIHKFPQTAISDASVPKFCFPDSAEFQPSSKITTSESYSFVLTNIDGDRLIGYCRRIQPGDSSLPEVICIVSPVDAFNMYNKLLSEIEIRRCTSLEGAKQLIEASFSRPLPSPGKACQIRCLNEREQMDTILMDRPLDQRLTNVNYESLLQYLGTSVLIKVFGSMLMERRLILCSQHLSILTQTIHALVALLYPFHWQHVYIPLLPPEMLEVCAAPMPFIIGILHSHLERVTDLELEEVIIVDLDKQQLLRCVGDESTLLPKKVQKALKTALNMCKVDKDTMSSRWLMVSEAFLRMFLEMMGHFGQHICTEQAGKKTLLRDQFIAGAPSKGIRQFLEWFTETQMFEMFISMQLERQHWGSLDLFMRRLVDLQSKRQTDGSVSKGLSKKVKDLGKAIKTKLK